MIRPSGVASDPDPVPRHLDCGTPDNVPCKRAVSGVLRSSRVPKHDDGDETGHMHGDEEGHAPILEQLPDRIRHPALRPRLDVPLAPAPAILDLQRAITSQRPFSEVPGAGS